MGSATRGEPPTGESNAPSAAAVSARSRGAQLNPRIESLASLSAASIDALELMVSLTGMGPSSILEPPAADVSGVLKTVMTRQNGQTMLGFV